MCVCTNDVIGGRKKKAKCVRECVFLFASNNKKKTKGLRVYAIGGHGSVAVEKCVGRYRRFSSS